MNQIWLVVVVVLALMGVCSHEARRSSQLDRAVMQALDESGGSGDTVALRGRAEAILGRSVSVGALFARLGRMEDAGIVVSWNEWGGRERGYRDRRLYRVIVSQARSTIGSAGGLPKSTESVGVVSDV